jgi:opacity protein-like surface antigen
MLKSLLTFAITLLILFPLKSQDLTLKGKTEYSVAFSYQSMKEKDDKEANWIMNLPLHFNYFVSDNIGVGAEINITDLKGDKNTGLVLNFLIEANFPSNQSKFIPFLLAGYGYSNGSFLFDRLAIKNYEDTGIGVLNLGGGAKFQVTEKVFVRTEARYQVFSGEYKYNNYFSGGSITGNIDITYLNVLLGFSIIL